MHHASIVPNRRVVYLLVVALLASSIVFYPFSSSAQQTGAWQRTTGYPPSVASGLPQPLGYESCATSGGYVYCVGGDGPSGFLNSSYYAPVSSSGIGIWKQTTDYPESVFGASCAADTLDIYCVGGVGGLYGENATFFAPISAGGIGAWRQTEDYPADSNPLGAAASCVLSSGYVFCVGGVETSTGIKNGTYFSKTSTSGVQSWQSSSSYPGPTNPTCSGASGFIYCVGGADQNGSQTPSRDVYLASLSPSGFGAWTESSQYGAPNEGASCAASPTFVLCAAGQGLDLSETNATFSAPISSGGLGPWSAGASYPEAVKGLSCLSPTGTQSVFCIGGLTASGATNSTYFITVVGGANKWTETGSTELASGVELQSCAISGTTLYCVGGEDALGPLDSSYFAQVTSDGLGNLSQTTSYPLGLVGGDCLADSGFLYCVGGNSSETFFAPLGSAGIGNWTRTTSYPMRIESQSCISYSGNLYCVGGESLGKATNSTYFAPVSASGIGDWKQGNEYPVAAGSISCSAYFGLVYCVGGTASQGASGYYSRLTASGFGIWTKTTPLPDDLLQASCVVEGGELYCVGGLVNNSTVSSVYDAPLSSAGIGSWVNSTAYPNPIEGQSCVSSIQDIYCLGGTASGTSAPTDAVYYSAPPNSTTTTLTKSTGLSSTTGASSSSSTGSSTQSLPSTSSSSGTTGQTGSYSGEEIEAAVAAIGLILVVAAVVLLRKRSQERVRG